MANNLKIDLLTWPLNWKRGHIYVEGEDVVISIPQYFDGVIVTPIKNVVVGTMSKSQQLISTNEPYRFANAPLVPYFVTLSDGLRPNLVLQFINPVRIPVMRRLLKTTARRSPLGFNEKQTKSAIGIEIDGVRLRVPKAEAARDSLSRHGVQKTDDPRQWEVQNRRPSPDEGKVRRGETKKKLRRFLFELSLISLVTEGCILLGLMHAHANVAHYAVPIVALNGIASLAPLIANFIHPRRV